ncbi:MAG: 3-phosphoshikimate 1-carboxyvinyltransferase [Erysipelotrichaceae bacterium]|nr:3-phosphoshikimate 1-carboxyvinyltransferase [Erysipelotrichaceae bacterium]
MISLPKREYGGTIKAPSSKSDGHRALIAAALVKEGVSKISNVYFSNDIKATISSLESLGAKFTIDNDIVYVKGISFSNDNPILNCEESGSTLRFLLPLATHFSNSSTFITKGKLGSRPLDVYEELFSISRTLQFTKSEGKLEGGILEIDGSISSQFISGLLFILPLLKNDSTIIIKNKIASLSYILMTIKLLKEFNVNINFDIESKRITIPGNQEYKKVEYVVENDFSQASFFLSLGAISSLPITVEGLDMNSLQPDKNIISILQSMGVSLKIENDQITTKKSLIKKTTVSLDENPDLGPILMGISAFAEEDITFTNISRLRIKESDRVEAMRDNLEKLGVTLELIDTDTCIVHPSKLKTPSKTLSSYNDHRIFMTLVLITHELKEVTIDDEKCVNKSYPTFLEDLKTIEKETTYE